MPGAAVRMAVVLAVSACLPANFAREPRQAPHINKVEPEVVQAGEIVVASGEYLDRSHVRDVVLANPDLTALAHIIQQTNESIKFQLPKSMPPGRYDILLATAEWQPELLDQQLFITVTY